MSNNKFSEGNSDSYAELPQPTNYLKWTRGDGKLAHLKDTDPGAFLGGWSALVSGSEEALPVLPLPIVQRTGDDGVSKYERYAHNFVNFLPITNRLRYEKRVKQFDQKLGREVNKVVSVVRKYNKELHGGVPGGEKGYQPMKQVFGLIYTNDGTQNAPAVLKIDTWSAFFSFSDAVKAWNKIKVPDGSVLVRRYGTIGVQTKEGTVAPNFETVGEGKYTPIQALGTSKPIIIKITPELDQLWEDAQAWANCERWNAANEATPEPATQMIEAGSGVYEEESPFGESPL